MSDKIRSSLHKILIVDDRPELRLLLRYHINKWFELDVLEAENGLEAMRLLRNTQGIVLILLDIMMPELDGLDTARLIKDEFPDRNFKICVVTAKDDEESVRQLLLQGIDDYIVKPVDEEIIRYKLIDLMKRDFDFHRPPFATIRTSIDGDILNVKYQDGTFIELSEYHCVFSSRIGFERGGMLLVHSPYFDKILGRKYNFYLKVMLCNKVKEEVFHSTCVFVALHENVRKSIRTLSIKGHEVKDGN